MTEPDPEPTHKNLTEAVDRALQAAFSENDADLGAQFLGDWIVVAEVHTTDGPILRIVNNNDTPLWRQQGMLRFAADDLTHDILVYRLVRHEEDD